MAKRAALLTIVGVALFAVPTPAAADWYFTPFIGYDFKATTTLFDPDYRGAERTKMTFGGSATLLHGIFGVEADYAFVPGFSTTSDPPVTMVNTPAAGGNLVAASHVQTLSGNFLVTTPLSLTRESLRPYAVIGLGWMEASVTGVALDAISVKTHRTALNLGLGAIGMLGERTGLRFDLRHFTNIDRDITGVSIGSAKLSFWRGTVGVTFRY